MSFRELRGEAHDCAGTVLVPSIGLGLEMSVAIATEGDTTGEARIGLATLRKPDSASRSSSRARTRWKDALRENPLAAFNVAPPSRANFIEVDTPDKSKDATTSMSPA